MPELPEVETVMRGLAPVLEGARLARVDQRRKDLRFPLPERFAERLQGCEVQRLERRAKYILAHLDTGEVLIIHLGMTGRFSIEKGANGHVPGQFVHRAGHDPRHDHILLTLSTGTVVRYNDARRFGYMDLVPADGLATHKLIRGLGMEPLGAALTAESLAEACAGKKTPLKSALLDQRIIAGLGNIYVCEALFRAGLDPRRSAATLATKAGAASVRCERLVAAIKQVLGEAIKAGGSSLRDFEQTDGSLGYFQHSFAVYGREGQSCRLSGCGGTIRRVVQTGRSTFYCPQCQR